jgi:hypothetical protein
VEADVARLVSEIAALVWWLRALTGVFAASLFVGGAVLHRVVRAERWQAKHGPTLERIGLEQQADDAARLLAVRRPHHSGTVDRPH